jgi:hypothetical protein
MPVEDSRPVLEHFNISKATTASTASSSGRVTHLESKTCLFGARLISAKMNGRRIAPVRARRIRFLTHGGADRPRKIRGRARTGRLARTSPNATIRPQVEETRPTKSPAEAGLCDRGTGSIGGQPEPALDQSEHNIGCHALAKLKLRNLPRPKQYIFVRVSYFKNVPESSPSAGAPAR